MALRRSSTGAPLHDQVYSTEAQTNAHLRYQERKDAQIKHLADRIKARAERTPAQQLALLDQRLGVGIGAMKERLRLNQQMARQQ